MIPCGSDHVPPGLEEKVGRPASNGKSPFWIGKPTINGQFSMSLCNKLPDAKRSLEPLDLEAVPGLLSRWFLLFSQWEIHQRWGNWFRASVYIVVLGSVPEEVSKSHRFFREFNHDFFHQSRGLTMGHMGCNIRIDNGWLIDDYMGLYCTIQYIGDCHGPAWEILLTVDQVGFEHCSVMFVSLNCPI